MQSENAIQYQPVQRIGQACLECRKKKTRCTGEQPSCKKCRRLHKSCVYPNSTQPKDCFRDNDIESLHASVATLSAKVSQVEQILEEVRDHLKGKPGTEGMSVLEDGAAVSALS